MMQETDRDRLTSKNTLWKSLFHHAMVATYNNNL